MGWTTPKTWVPGEVLSASDFNTHLRDNLNALLTRPLGAVLWSNGADYTTSSTSFVDIDGTNLAKTITPVSTKVLLLFSATAYIGGLTSYFDFTVDGTRLGGANGLQVAGSSAVNTTMPVFMAAVVTVTPGAVHTFKVQWKASGGTISLYANTTFPSLIALEIG